MKGEKNKVYIKLFAILMPIRIVVSKEKVTCFRQVYPDS